MDTQTVHRVRLVDLAEGSAGSHPHLSPSLPGTHGCVFARERYVGKVAGRRAPSLLSLCPRTEHTQTRAKAPAHCCENSDRPVDSAGTPRVSVMKSYRHNKYPGCPCCKFM